MKSKRKERVLVISDTQAPFQHQDTIRFLEYCKKKYRPTKVIHIGDIIDAHAFSPRWEKNPNGLSGKEEIFRARDFVKALAKVFPKMVVLRGNHDTRVFKSARKAGLLDDMIKDIGEIIKAPKTWEFKDKEEIDGVTYVHGNQVHSGGGNMMMNAVKKYMKNVVFGHYHTRFGIDYHANEDNLMFGMCVGSLVDHHQYAFEYQSQSPRKPIIGVGIVDDGSPLLVPMILNKAGRWDKRKQ